MVTWCSTRVLALDWSSEVLQKHRPKMITGSQRHRPGSAGWDCAEVPGVQAVLCLQLWVSTQKTQRSRVPFPDVKRWGYVSAVEMQYEEFYSWAAACGVSARRVVSVPSSPGEDRDGDRDSLPPWLQLALPAGQVGFSGSKGGCCCGRGSVVK